MKKEEWRVRGNVPSEWRRRWWGWCGGIRSTFLISLSLAFSSPAASVFSSSYKSGLTQSNYKELNVLYEKYKNQGLEILAFPCNQFAGQEPGSNEEIQDVVCTMFKAEFPIFDKVEVNGKNTVPLYKFLKSEKGGYFADAIKWNFTKFLVDKQGKVVERYIRSNHITS